MTGHRHWQLPEGVDELLPPAAWQLEVTRRRVLDVFRTWGFDYVDPPVIEYLDALLVGTSADMDLQTLKAVDQRSGRLLGVRADMTAQAARIDAHSLPAAGVQRLCYAGSVVHANPAAPLDSRVPLKAGAEIFGAQSPSADAEVIALMMDVLRAAAVEEPVLALGHVGIYQALTANLELTDEDQQALFSAVQSKSETDIAELLGAGPLTDALVCLPSLMGRRDVLNQARDLLSRSPGPVLAAIDALEALSDLVLARCPDVELRFDLAELAGYGYHNGAVFTAYQSRHGSALARGGRYDGIGAAFGRWRAATGFDVSLKMLVPRQCPTESAVWAPWVDGDTRRRQALLAELKRLRAAGETVIAAVSDSDRPPVRCDRILSETGGAWAVTPLTRNE